MILNNEDYSINGEEITIKKQTLEDWRNHYVNVAKRKETLKLFYLGKVGVLTDLLKHFDELEL